MHPSSAFMGQVEAVGAPRLLGGREHTKLALSILGSLLLQIFFTSAMISCTLKSMQKYVRNWCTPFPSNRFFLLQNWFCCTHAALGELLSIKVIYTCSTISWTSKQFPSTDWLFSNLRFPISVPMTCVIQNTLKFLKSLLAI